MKCKKKCYTCCSFTGVNREENNNKTEYKRKEKIRPSSLLLGILPRKIYECEMMTNSCACMISEIFCCAGCCSALRLAT